MRNANIYLNACQCCGTQISLRSYACVCVCVLCACLRACGRCVSHRGMLLRLASVIDSTWTGIFGVWISQLVRYKRHRLASLPMLWYLAPSLELCAFVTCVPAFINAISNFRAARRRDSNESIYFQIKYPLHATRHNIWNGWMCVRVRVCLLLCAVLLAGVLSNFSLVKLHCFRRH